MSTDPRKIGIASLAWSQVGPAELHFHRVRDTAELVALIADNQSKDSWWAVDVPFGWPEDFAIWLSAHRDGPASLPAPSSHVGGRRSPSAWSALAGRVTDYYVRASLGRAGLSVSFDKLGATAAHWAQIEHALANRGIVIDRSGQIGRIFETWPSAAWRPFTGGIANPATLEAADFTMALHGVVEFDDAWEGLTEAQRPHVQDAIVCALVAKARVLRRTEPIPAEHALVAKREGWIHLPDVRLGQLAQH